LHHVYVVQPIPDRLVLRRRRVCLDRSPMFRISPSLMAAKIAK
jgi:hypothetical protein